MSGPERVQLRRTKGWRMPPNTVVVARPSRWGNWWAIRTPAELMPRCSTDTSPVVVRLDTNGNWQYPVLGGFDTVAEARAFAVALHRRSMLGTRVVLDGLIDHELYLAPLRGKNLACWCPLDQPCHADVLLELANEDMVKEGRL